MSNEIKAFLTHEGEFFPVEADEKLKQFRDHQVLTVKVYPKDLHVSDSMGHPRQRTDRNATYILNEEGEVIDIIVRKRSIIKKYSFGASKRLKFILRIFLISWK